MILRGLLLALFGTAIAGSATRQALAVPPQLSAVTNTAYSNLTEVFAEWKPFVVADATRVAAHLTRMGETAFRPYPEGKVTFTFNVADIATNGTAYPLSVPASSG